MKKRERVEIVVEIEREKSEIQRQDVETGDRERGKSGRETDRQLQEQRSPTADSANSQVESLMWWVEQTLTLSSTGNNNNLQCHTRLSLYRAFPFFLIITES